MKEIDEVVEKLTKCCKVCQCSEGIKIWCACHRKTLQELLQSQTQDIREKVESKIKPDALDISKRLRKELGKGRPVTESMVLGACMGFDYALKDVLKQLSE